MNTAGQHPPAPAFSPSIPPEPVAVRKWETPRPGKRGRELHFELDAATVPRMEHGVIPTTNLFFSAFFKGASAGIVLPTEAVSKQIVSVIDAFIHSLPDAAAHQPALAQLKVSCLTVKPYTGGLVYVVQVHGREPTLSALSRHVLQPSQAGALVVTVTGHTMPFMLHRGHDNSYIHSHMLVAISSPHEVDPALLSDLMLSHTASPLLGCQWVGLVQSSAQGHCLAWVKGSTASTNPSPLPPWVRDHVKPGSLLALVSAFLAPNCTYHYPAQPGSTSPPRDRRLPVYLRRVQNLIAPPPLHGRTPPSPSAGGQGTPPGPSMTHKRHHEDPSAGVPARELPSGAAAVDRALSFPPLIPVCSASPQHADKRREVPPAPSTSRSHFPTSPRPAAHSARHPPPPPSPSPDLPPEVLPFLAFARHKEQHEALQSATLTPNSFQVLSPTAGLPPVLSTDDVASYGADSVQLAPENANDVVEMMAAALDAPVAGPEGQPDFMDTDAAVLTSADLQGLRPDDRHRKIHAWFSHGQPRLSLLAWVEQSPFPPNMMTVVLRTVIHHVQSVCFGKGQPVDLRSGGTEIFDKACQCLRRRLPTAPCNRPHV